MASRAPTLNIGLHRTARKCGCVCESASDMVCFLLAQLRSHKQQHTPRSLTYVIPYYLQPNHQIGCAFKRTRQMTSATASVDTDPINYLLLNEQMNQRLNFHLLIFSIVSRLNRNCNLYSLTSAEGVSFFISNQPWSSNPAIFHTTIRSSSIA